MLWRPVVASKTMIITIRSGYRYKQDGMMGLLSRTNGCAKIDEYESLREGCEMTRCKGVLHGTGIDGPRTMNIGNYVTNWMHAPEFHERSVTQ